MGETVKMQAAWLMAGTSAVAEVEVPAFPNNPTLVRWDGRYFAHGTIGYGVGYLTYSEVRCYGVASK